MKYIYICNAVPQQVCDYKQLSVAGNKFSLNMAHAIDRAAHGNLELISTSTVERQTIERLSSYEIWKGKKFYPIRRGKHFLLSEIFQAGRLFFFIRRYRQQHKNEKIVIILENSPMGAAVCSTLLKRLYKIACFSITIDTPFTGAVSFRGLIGKINYWCFKTGQHQLKRFNGIITFTQEACKQLNLHIPCCEFAIGFNLQRFPAKAPDTFREDADKKIVYTGTLIYYNGIIEMLDAFKRLGRQYQLHIYGYGPLEKDVQEAAQKYPNIIYHGRFSPNDTQQILSKYDLLLNLRVLDSFIENFTFPSKLIDYMLSGKSILSSNFKTLPTAYHDFIYMINSVSVDEIIDGIKRVFQDSPDTRFEKSRKALEYLKNYQTYDIIAKKITLFIEKES